MKDLFNFIQARYQITEARAAGKPKPWTKDKILLNYRFCNMHREDDTVTKWIAKHWRKPHAKDPNLWFAMAVARLTNWPATMHDLGYPVLHGVWSPKCFLSMVKNRQANGQQVYGGAYTISTNGRKMLKHDYLVEQVFNPMWAAREPVSSYLTLKGATLQGLHNSLIGFQGLGSFIAAQVIADLKYEQLKKAPDWWTFAASGPGSRRGLNRVLGFDKDKAYSETLWRTDFALLYDQVAGMVNGAGIRPMHGQDVQNALCEFDKYERVRLGEGTPRCRYPGAA